MINYTFDPVWKINFPVLITVRINKPFNYMDMHNWLKENCKAKFYILPVYAGLGCQFEDDEDATLFALRWS